MLSNFASGLRINSYSLAAEVKYGTPQENTEPPSPLSALMGKLSAAEKYSLFKVMWATAEQELSVGLLKGRFSGDELLFLKEKSSKLYDAKPQRVERELQDPRILAMMQKVSGDEIKGSDSLGRCHIDARIVGRGPEGQAVSRRDFIRKR